MEGVAPYRRPLDLHFRCESVPMTIYLRGRQQVSETRLSRVLSGTASIVLTICAVAVTARVFAGPVDTPPPPAIGVGVQFDSQPDWREYATAGRWLGDPNASVVLVEFADYQCSWCKRFESHLSALRSKYPKDFAVLYRHWPLTSIHPHAKTAAVAAECAGRQHRFEAMHAALYRDAESLGRVPWTTIAQGAGVADTGEFARCLEDPAAIAVIEADSTAANQLGARGTPTSLLSGRRIRGSIPLQALETLVLEEMRRAKVQRARR